MDKTELPEPACCAFAFCNKVLADDNIPRPHTHPCTEIIFLGKVSGWMHEDARKLRYGPNQVAVYQPGTRHWAINDPGTRGTHTCLGVSGSRPAAIPAAVYPADGDLMLLFRLVENTLAKPLAPREQRQRLDHLADLVCQSLEGKATKPGTAALADYAALAKQIIDTEFTTPLTLDDLSGRICISADYLRQLFRREYGVAPIHYLIAKRIEHARGLLVASDAKIGEVAAQCGFSDPYYFSRLFRKMVGRSPKQVREAGR